MIIFRTFTILIAGLFPVATLAGAEPGWPDLLKAIYGDRIMVPAGDVIALSAPYRSVDDTRAPLGADIVAPIGKKLVSVTLVIDDNPMPVSAVFEFTQPQRRFDFEGTFRINGPTPIHVIAETADGALYVAEQFVKTTGQAACSAPPGTDPEAALATLGNMTIVFEEGRLAEGTHKPVGGMSGFSKRATLTISHPSHSGLQMDQITLLYTPMRYVQDVDITVNGDAYVNLSGSISLSENPELTLSVPGDTRLVGVTMTDSDGTVSTVTQGVTGY